MGGWGGGYLCDGISVVSTCLVSSSAASVGCLVSFGSADDYVDQIQTRSTSRMRVTKTLASLVIHLSDAFRCVTRESFCRAICSRICEDWTLLMASSLRPRWIWGERSTCPLTVPRQRHGTVHQYVLLCDTRVKKGWCVLSDREVSVIELQLERGMRNKLTSFISLSEGLCCHHSSNRTCLLLKLSI